MKDEKLEKIAGKIYSGARLDFEDGITLFESKDISSLGSLASIVSEKKNGKLAYFNVNVHITPTNICTGTCRFCAFRKKKGEKGAFELTTDQIIEKISKLIPKGITEVHIVGGLHPDWKYQHYINMIKEIRGNFPHIYIKAFTAEEISYISRIGNKTIHQTLHDLIEAGVDSIPGGGGEIFNESIRKKLCPDKISSEEYLKIHKTAHRMGLTSNATMLFGHIESIADRVDHILRIRQAQEETGGFQSFIPLAFHPFNTDIKNARKTTGIDELKTIAVSRLLLDNIQHIKAYWVMLGEKVAQISLAFGADDIDGTVIEEEITQAAGAEENPYTPKDRLIQLIKEVGKTPVERDTLYNILKIY